MVANVTKFGPGTFRLGGTPGTDYSCQVQSLALNTDKDEGDQITVLCGDVIPASVVYKYTLAGTVLQDLAIASGLVEYSWTHKGESVAFEFAPSTAAVTSVSGNVRVDPLPIGTPDGAFGDNLTSDFEWPTDEPVVTWPTGP